MRKFVIGETKITDKSILVSLSSDELHLIRDSLLVYQGGNIDKEEFSICRDLRSSIGRILCDPFQR